MPDQLSVPEIEMMQVQTKMASERSIQNRKSKIVSDAGAVELRNNTGHTV
jgi:hypothetical protein